MLLLLEFSSCERLVLLMPFNAGACCLRPVSAQGCSWIQQSMALRAAVTYHAPKALFCFRHCPHKQGAKWFPKELLVNALIVVRCIISWPQHVAELGLSLAWQFLVRAYWR